MLYELIKSKNNYEQNNYNKILKLSGLSNGISGHKIKNRYEQKILKKKIAKLVRILNLLLIRNKPDNIANAFLATQSILQRSMFMI